VAESDYAGLIVDIPDYPEPGVIFKDITPLMADPKGFAAAIDDLADHFKDAGITKVVGAEARGFLVGAPVAYRLGAGFVPARKPGKLPRDVYSQTYSLEYGTDELQIHKDALSADDKVLIIDDLVATGGTAVATAKLVEQAGAEVMGFGFILELCYLDPRKEIGASYGQDVFTLIKVK
jgi:adenine phosphoribosyltransferase